MSTYKYHFTLLQIFSLHCGNSYVFSKAILKPLLRCCILGFCIDSSMFDPDRVWTVIWALAGLCHIHLASFVCWIFCLDSLIAAKTYIHPQSLLLLWVNLDIDFVVNKKTLQEPLTCGTAGQRVYPPCIMASISAWKSLYFLNSTLPKWNK